MDDAFPASPHVAEVDAFLLRRHGDGSSLAREWRALDDAWEPMQELVVISDGAGGEARYLVTWTPPGGTWVSRATCDERPRVAGLLDSGVLSALPAGVATATVYAQGLEGGGSVVAERDTAPLRAGPGMAPVSDTQAERALAALARLHSAYYGFPARLLGGIGVCALGQWLSLYSPATGERERAAPPGSVPAMLGPGWRAFARQAPEVWAALEPLLAQPQPLVVALRECPDTVIHGDARLTNVAVGPEQVTLLGWETCARAPGGLDLGWFLAANDGRLPIARERAIEVYRVERERLGRLPASGERWERELSLSLLAGVMRAGWSLALAAEGDASSSPSSEAVRWWAQAALEAQRWL